MFGHQFSSMARKMEKKYKIQEQVEKLPRFVTMAHLLKELERHGITSSTFYRDRDISKTSPTSIPSDRLDAYAVVFGCTIEDLKNYTITGKSIHEVMAQPKKLKTSLK